MGLYDRHWRGYRHVGDSEMADVMKTCSDFPGSCCTSCHEDCAEGDEDLLEVIGPDGAIFARVCCNKIEAAEEAKC